MYPTSNHTVGTVYGARGPMWSNGIHKGVDFPVQTGTVVVAPWSGTVTGVSWGSAFGKHVVLKCDTLPNGAPGLYVGLCHLSHIDVVGGQRVSAGQRIGLSGATGNVSGPHLHMEVQRSSSWSANGHTDPSPWLRASSGGSSSAHGGGGTVLLSKLKYGQRDSDSVRELQKALNKHLGLHLPASGNYLDQTDAAVRKCQSEHGYGNDAPKKSFVGQRQATHLGLHTG